MTPNPARMAALILLVLPALVEAQDDNTLERFRFFTECAPVSLGVLVLDDDDEPIGLTEDRVRTMAESRLRAARLYWPEVVDSAATLQLRVTVFRDAYAYNAAIVKRRSDPFTGGTLPTNGISFPDIGTHSGGATAANFIMQSLTEQVDELISDYLRVNEAAC